MRLEKKKVIISEFDFQWEHIPSRYTHYNRKRIDEFLGFTQIPKEYFRDKWCMDAGCGNGRYTYALQQLGAKVKSFDKSREAIRWCQRINPEAYVKDIMTLPLWSRFAEEEFDFILCWGVLHHLEHPKMGFDFLVKFLKPGGIIHIMVYNKTTQGRYESLREEFRALPTYEDKVNFCKKIDPANVHGWFDALNPQFNHSFTVEEVLEWFEGFENVRVITRENININGELPR